MCLFRKQEGDGTRPQMLRPRFFTILNIPRDFAVTIIRGRVSVCNLRRSNYMAKCGCAYFLA